MDPKPEPCLAHKLPGGHELAVVGVLVGAGISRGVCAEVAERLAAARKVYGNLDTIRDKRSWRFEARQEILDALAYEAMETFRNGVTRQVLIGGHAFSRMYVLERLLEL